MENIDFLQTLDAGIRIKKFYPGSVAADCKAALQALGIPQPAKHISLRNMGITIWEARSTYTKPVYATTFAEVVVKLLIANKPLAGDAMGAGK